MTYPGISALFPARKDTVAGLFRAVAQEHGGRIAIQDGRRSWTYEELDQRTDYLCALLGTYGILRGDRLTVLSENRHEYLEVVLAAAKMGVTVACLNWRHSEAELQHCISLAKPALQFVSERFASLPTGDGGQAGKRIVFGSDYERCLMMGDTSLERDQPQPEDGLTLLYTSGTTGRAKGAVISQRALVARAQICWLDEIIIPGLTFVAWAPFCHIGANDSSLATLMSGGKVVIVDGFKPAEIADAIVENRIGWLSLAGTVGRMLSELKGRGDLRDRVRVVGSMPDLVPRSDIADITTLLNAPFLNTFASTETGLAPASRGRIPIGTVPGPLAKTQSSLCEIRLADDQGQDVPPGIPGVLMMRGPSLFSGYFGDPEATAAAFRDGWYVTGDLFSRNEDGKLEYAGREKYLVKSGGENIYPSEIEQLVLASPRVEEAVLVGKPDDTWGEIPVLIVVKRDEALSKEDIVSCYEGKIAAYKRPKRIIFTRNDMLPRSATGKVQRNLIDLSSLS